MLLISYRSWRVPMVVFGLMGVVAIAVIAVTVRPWFSETIRVAQVGADLRGAPTLRNRNTVLLAVMSALHGIILYSYLGMYASFLRESLHYTPTQAGLVMGSFGLGALTSVAGGWLGDRFSPRAVLSIAFLCAAVCGYLFFHGSEAIMAKAILSCVFGILASSILYVNLAAYHVKSVRSTLVSRASGIFVTCVYVSAAFAGYMMGGLASYAGWVLAGEIQISLLAVISAGLALALRPNQMAL
jgi:predicted MFS family arabinose efflux permease